MRVIRIINSEESFHEFIDIEVSVLALPQDRIIVHFKEEIKGE